MFDRIRRYIKNKELERKINLTISKGQKVNRNHKHDWRKSVRFSWQSNVVETIATCRKCGKKRKYYDPVKD